MKDHLSTMMDEAKVIATRRLEQEVFMAHQMKGELFVTNFILL